VSDAVAETRHHVPAERRTASSPVALVAPGWTNLGGLSALDTEPARVLIVDDDDLVRRALSRILDRQGYQCWTAAHALEARALVAKQTFDLMLVDVSMPGESGLELSRSLLKEHPELAVVVVSGHGSPLAAREAFSIGVYGFVLKPVQVNEVLINVVNALRRRKLEAENRQHREHLEKLVEQRASALRDAIERLRAAEREIRNSQAETIHRLSKAAEFRDNETARHIERMSRYCEMIAARLGLPEERSSMLRLASPLHDIGKIGTPDHILLKPGKLTPEEFAIMREHAENGYRILAASDSELLRVAASIARTHHERMDGKGYPRGLVGKEIPLEGRIAAVADVFDALTSVRVYKAAMSNEKSISILEEGRDTHFDGHVLDAFLASMGQVVSIQADFADG
jgi:putative two-component system response regulator